MSEQIDDYSNWIDDLGSDFTVKQGNVFLMVNTECPKFIEIFGTCFGQNPAAPYIIPQPPVEGSYVDPYYGEPLNDETEDGETTNIIYRLSDNEALITIVAYPPKAAFLGYQSYVFTSLKENYTDIVPPRSRMTSPNPDRYEIFGSIGNDVNNVIVENQYGSEPWGKAVAVYITTSNKKLAKALIKSAEEAGISSESIFIEPVGASVVTGNGEKSDDMMTLMRYAVPESEEKATAWLDELDNNVLVYKVSNTKIGVERYGDTSYIPHTVNNEETTYFPSLSKAQKQLASLLQKYLQTSEPTHASYMAFDITTTINEEGIPDGGLVGSVCIEYGVNCIGDDQDTSTYANLVLARLGLEETAFVVGVNHTVETLDNSRYISVGVYDTVTTAGVASSSQTDPRSTGFESGILTGSAAGILDALDITIPPTDKELIANIENLYVVAIARDINNPTIEPASEYCINLMGTTLIPLENPINITERSYIVPGTTTGGDLNYMIYPLLVTATQNFLSEPSTID